MNKYKVSIIMPCYNVEGISTDNSFEKTIESIKNQSFSFENIELILVDDGSTDNTKNILKKLSVEYSNIKTYNFKKNSGGPSAPRNLGLEKSTAKYVMFLDQDDTLNLETIEELVNTIEKENVDIVKCNHNILINDEIHKREVCDDEKLIIKPKTSNLKYITLYIWDAIYRREFLKNNKIFFINMRGEDFIFSASCLSKTDKNIIYLNSLRGINYNSNNLQSISHNCYNLKNLEENIIVSDSCMKIFIDFKFDEEYLNYISTNFKKDSMIYMFYSNDSSEIKEEMFRLLRQFLVKYKNFPFIKSPDLKTMHNLFWKICNFLIVNNYKKMFLSIINILKRIKSTDRS